MNSEGSMKEFVRKSRIPILLFVGFVGICGFFLRGCLPGGDRILARATTRNGVEMCVVQKYNNNWAEPYTVSFYYRHPGQRWGWFYYDHEDTRWMSGDIKLSDDEKVAQIYRQGKEVARFEIPTESFTILRWTRTLSPAQDWMPDGWRPEDSLNSVVSARSPIEVGAPNNAPPKTQ